MTDIPSAAQARADADVKAAVATERRFADLEESVRASRAESQFRQGEILEAITELTNTVKTQNGRLGRLEDWKREFITAQAYAKGLVEGGAKLGAKQLAFLAVAGPAIFAAIDYILRVLHK